ncbi:MAG TPA: nuclear transport factor 2 family protein [Candidatus Limnocylindrales bacterium]|jgi:nuclear transport factor 2 (NTF2) superfamily protein
MTHDDVARWLEAYVDAWMTYDPDRIRALFTADAEYRYRPSDEPLRGRDAIVADWLADTDAPGTYEASYAPWAVEGSRGVATGTSRYSAPDNNTVYHNVFLLEFDDAGVCSSFTEVFVEQRR